MKSDSKSLLDLHPRVLFRILHALNVYGPLGRTKLAMASNISYDTLQSYLLVLSSKRFISSSIIESGQEVVQIEDAGRAMLSQLSIWDDQMSG